MSGQGTDAASSTPWEKNLARLQAIVVDAVLIGIALLMVEFLALAFSGRRGPTGLLLSAEQILDLLHYAWAALGGLALALLWNMFHRQLGASPGRAWVRGIPESEEGLEWTQTLRGWFGAVFIELTFFTGWLITELDLVTFLTKFGKAADIIRGLMNPSATVLHEGLVLLVQTVFLAFMATAFAIPVAFVLAFPSARNLTRSTSIAHTPSGSSVQSSPAGPPAFPFSRLIRGPRSRYRAGNRLDHRSGGSTT